MTQGKQEGKKQEEEEIIQVSCAVFQRVPSHGMLLFPGEPLALGHTWTLCAMASIHLHNCCDYMKGFITQFSSPNFHMKENIVKFHIYL